LVDVKVERIGGGFGGKQARPKFLAAAAAVAARASGLPVVIQVREKLEYFVFLFDDARSL
jgi:xanthine dehydrogenase molybdopterin-binding subunit B